MKTVVYEVKLLRNMHENNYHHNIEKSKNELVASLEQMWLFLAIIFNMNKKVEAIKI